VKPGDVHHCGWGHGRGFGTKAPKAPIEGLETLFPQIATLFVVMHCLTHFAQCSKYGTPNLIADIKIIRAKMG